MVGTRVENMSFVAKGEDKAMYLLINGNPKGHNDKSKWLAALKQMIKILIQLKKLQ